MKTIQVRLSKFQREELSHKLGVMREGFDNDDGTVEEGYMAHHYNFQHIDELEAMDAKVSESPNAPSRIVTLDEREARAAWGEFENAWDIAADNAGDGQDEDERQYASAAKRLKQAMQRIEEAATAAGFDATRVIR